ncbi:endothelin-converting enzyme 2-like [Ornithodoros turicata]|uniref:endothelin-converting enzyme 2-like n=1 Tax=Ornithodoros turicata TaxID=34597 RepID=UPI003138A741
MPYGALRSPEPVSSSAVADAQHRQNVVKKSGAIICCVTCIIVATFIVVKVFTKSGQLRKAEFCNTYDCMQYGEILDASLDTSQDPCQNFYRFVCSGWDKAHKHPVYYEHRRAQLLAIAQKAETVKIPPRAQNAEQKAARYYQSCIEVALKKRSEQDYFIQMLRDGNITWPNRPQAGDLLQVMAYAVVKWDTSPLLAFSKSQLPNGTIVLGISPGPFAIASRSIREHLILKNIYYDYFSKAYELMRGNGTSRDAYQKHNETEVTIIALLAAGLVSEIHAELSEHDFEALSTAFEYNRWQNMFKSMFGVPEDKQICINLKNLAFFKELNNATSLLSETVMIEYLSWGVIIEIGHLFLPDMANLLNKSSEKLKDASKYRCLLHVEKYMAYALTMPYLSTAIPPQTDVDVANLYGNVTAVMGKYVGTLHFNYREYLKRKNFTDIFFGFGHAMSLSELEKTYGVFPDMGTLFTNNLLQAVATRRQHHVSDAVYLHRLNYYEMYDESRGGIVVLPFAYNLPIHSTTIPYAVRYGGLGSLLLTGIVEDLYANAIPQMSVASQTVLVGVRSCFKNQTSSEGVLRAYESIGLQLLTQAYDHVLRQESKRKLKDLPKYADTQLMLIAACYLRCRGSKDVQEEVCNVPMKNLNYFGQTFGCAKGSPMNPTQKCSLL